MNQPRESALSLVPDCGLSCLAAGLSHTACALTDVTCLCLDQIYNDWVTSCVVSNCTIRNQLTTQYATKTNCGIAPVDNPSFMTPEIIVFAFATFFICLRLANRFKRMAVWGWDDTTCVLAWILCLGFLGVGIAEVKLGAGLPTWAKAKDNAFWKIDGALFVFFVSMALYTVTLGLVKSSILFLYLRIFGQSGDTLRRLILATQIFNLLAVLAFLAFDFALCKPLDHFWKSWDLEHQGTCFNTNAFSFAHAGLNIALDVWMIALPLEQVWKLNMNFRHKLEAMSMLSVGIFLTITSCIRVTALLDFAKNPSNIEAYFPISIWTVVEINIGVVVACMPAARVYVAKVATDIAHSAKWTRFSADKKPLSYDSSNPPSFVKRRSEKRAASRFNKLVLPSRLGGTHFANSVHREVEEVQDDGAGPRRYDEESFVELVDRIPTGGTR